MNEQEKIIAKIKEAAYENVNRKLEEERKIVENKISNELVDAEKCLQYINNKMVYKIIRDRYLIKEYCLADENMFFEDYTKDVEYTWNKGIEFYNTKTMPTEPLFVVNGESYYDMRHIIRNYEETFALYSKKLDDLNNKFKEISEAAEELKKHEPHIKNLIEQYKKVEIDESYMNNLQD